MTLILLFTNVLIFYVLSRFSIFWNLFDVHYSLISANENFVCPVNLGSCFTCLTNRMASLVKLQISSGPFEQSLRHTLLVFCSLIKTQRVNLILFALFRYLFCFSSSQLTKIKFQISKKIKNSIFSYFDRAGIDLSFIRCTMNC